MNKKKLPDHLLREDCVVFKVQDVHWSICRTLRQGGPSALNTTEDGDTALACSALVSLSPVVFHVLSLPVIESKRRPTRQGPN